MYLSKEAVFRWSLNCYQISKIEASLQKPGFLELNQFHDV